MGMRAKNACLAIVNLRIMSLPKIQEVVDNDLCIACGACIEACPKDVVAASFNAYRGAAEVEIGTDGQPCLGCPAPCDSVCPSLVSDLRKSEDLLQTEEGVRFGPIKRASLGFANPHRFNGISSSGGIVRAIIYDALDRGEAVVCLAGDGAGGYVPERLEKPEDLERVPGSIYHSVTFAGAIDLCRTSGSPCVIVATPCQLAGIDNYIRTQEPSLERSISLRVGLICGWMYTTHSLGAFASYKGIQEPVANALYRGEDEKGLLKFTAEGKTHSFPRRDFSSKKEDQDYRASFSSVMNRLRCRVCEDHLNVLADVAVGDAWLRRKEGEKTSIVLARTELGCQRIRELELSSKIELEDSDAANDLLESQSRSLVLGTDAKEMASWLRSRGKITPQFLYDDAPATLPKTLPLKTRIKYSIEMILRRIVRSRHYRLYHRLYRIRAWIILKSTK
jgi:coenzyme F420-reducing hydrogenase beta subunit